MDLEEIKQASADMLEAERENSKGVTESTPAMLTAHIEAFASSLANSPPVFIPVTQDAHGLYGWCSDGVLEKVKADGGRPIFGWTIWEWPPVLLTAEFHCVWQSPEGVLHDITPKPKREATIVFVPDLSYAVDFDFDNRPLNRRMRIYTAADRQDEAQAIKAKLQGAQLSYEERRAEKAGVSLEDWLLRKVPVDPLPDAIDDVISACNDFEAYFDTFGAYGAFMPDEKLMGLMERRVKAQTKLKRLM